jgi:hypothetical protein
MFHIKSRALFAKGYIHVIPDLIMRLGANHIKLFDIDGTTVPVDQQQS